MAKLAKATQEGDVVEIARAWNNMGTAYSSVGDWAKAMEHHERCLAELKPECPVEDHIIAYGNAAAVARQLKDWDKALDYTLRSEVIAARHEQKEYLDTTAGGVLLVRQAVGKQRFEELYAAAEARVPEEDRPLLQTERHLNPTVVKEATPGRNDPCPCGSGKKYKKCCGR
jgi:uncharacterized protein YchJ